MFFLLLLYEIKYITQKGVEMEYFIWDLRLSYRIDELMKKKVQFTNCGD